MKFETQQKFSNILVNYVLWPLLQLIAALASAIAVTASLTLGAAANAAHAAVLTDGPSPAAQTSANMPQARLTIHYNRIFMQWLYMYLNKLLLCTHMDLPEKSGQTFRNFMSVTLGADTEQQTEGTIGSPEQITVNFRDIVVGQWANYNNISDLAFMTSISNDLEENRRIMAYQLGQTVDDLVMYMIDYLRTFDSRTSNQDSLVAPYAFGKNIIEQIPASLSGATVPPMDSGTYNGSIHPFFVGDLQLDNGNNSVVDIWKHTDAGQLKLEGLTQADEGQGSTRILELLGAPVAPEHQPDAVRGLAGRQRHRSEHLLRGQERDRVHQLPEQAAHEDRPALGEHEPVGGRVHGQDRLRPERADLWRHGLQLRAGRGPAPRSGGNQPHEDCGGGATDDVKTGNKGLGTRDRQ